MNYIGYLQTKKLVGYSALESVEIFVQGFITVFDILLQFLNPISHPESVIDLDLTVI